VSDLERVLDTGGPAAPPRRNGELVFEAPWQSRVFGLTVALHEQGRFAWDEFRDRLIAAIARDDADDAAVARGYWACWLEAFEALLAAKGLCADEALRERATRLAARPAGHDH
jgi:nitrile hydratase accessory protein